MTIKLSLKVVSKSTILLIAQLKPIILLMHSSRGERGESKENRDKSDAPAKVTVISGVARVAVSCFFGTILGAFESAGKSDGHLGGCESCGEFVFQ